jgi:hypothetical protein
MRTTTVTLAAGVAALALVVGGAGMAIAQAQGTDTRAAATPSLTGGATTSTAAPGAPAKAVKGGPFGRDAGRRILGNVKNFQHAEWVTKGDANAYVTHEAILGQVTAVSATSVTVKSADGTSMTFAVTADTKVHQRRAKGASAPATRTIADVKTGQTVLVGGVKSPELTAKNVLVSAG